MAASTESSQHVLLVPFMAQGHFIPFLELADLLIRRASVTATIVTTPLNVTKLRSSIPNDSPIRFAELPFSSSDHGLPPDSESTDTVPAPYMPTFILATETLQAPFERLVSGILEDGRRRPILIISDFLVGWTVETARKLKVPHASFSTSGAFGTAVILALWLHFPHLNADSDTFNLPGFPESVQLHRSQLPPPMRGLTPTDPPAVLAGGSYNPTPCSSIRWRKSKKRGRRSSRASSPCQCGSSALSSLADSGGGRKIKSLMAAG